MSDQPVQNFHLQQATWKNSSFSIALEGVPFGEFVAPPMKWEGHFDLAGRRLTVKTKNPLTTSAHLADENGTPVAQGVSAGIFRKTYTVSSGNEVYVVRITGPLAYAIYWGETALGSAKGESYGASSGYVTLPTPMSLECKLLLLWFFGRSWRSANSSSAGG